MNYSRTYLVLLVAVVVLPLAIAKEKLGPRHHGCCSQCGCQQCQVVEEIVHQEVTQHVCELTEESKPNKKTVYSCKDKPYCLLKLPKYLHPDCCPECECSGRVKRVLVKKDETCGETKKPVCKVKEVKTTVAVRVCRVVCPQCQHVEVVNVPQPPVAPPTADAPLPPEVAPVDVAPMPTLAPAK